MKTCPICGAALNVVRWHRRWHEGMGQMTGDGWPEDDS